MSKVLLELVDANTGQSLPRALLSAVRYKAARGHVGNPTRRASTDDWRRARAVVLIGVSTILTGISRLVWLRPRGGGSTAGWWLQPQQYCNATVALQMEKEGRPLLAAMPCSFRTHLLLLWKRLLRCLESASQLGPAAARRCIVRLVDEVTQQTVGEALCQLVRVKWNGVSCGRGIEALAVR